MKMTNWIAAAPFVAAALGAQPLAAQDADPGESEIVVEGVTEQEEQAVRELARRVTANDGHDTPATRFLDALCVSVSGLNRAGNEYIERRIRQNAAETGVPVQGEDCRVNAQVLIHNDIPGLVQRIKNEHVGMLTRDERVEVDAAVERGDRIVAWHNEEDRNQGGRRIRYGTDVAGMVASPTGLNVTARLNDNAWPSRTELPSSRGVVSAAILIDSEVAQGMLIERLADYATMRLLAPDFIPPGADETEPASVTSPFPQEGGAEDLTRFDRAYLQALYSLRPNAPSSRLARAVSRQYVYGE
ncbi:hypothetical protein [Aurantiacibacter poecillastricola]|uniref:hypothetical protein n=1 Tax=Aurantiacibacter poecillastricola TaxID=3064385 RepID=UPI00273FD4DA|nr:hypothetical protein [Aurantiacibacter sp. 219JJ12-13]MDP5261535.1 hypothetical protein [Aurantiacibacter sp. 219JJ12-13]